MHLLDRIGLDTSVRFGKPCVRGTRISVGDVLGYFAAGMSEEQLLQDFPQLVRDDIRACLAYAAERERSACRPPFADAPSATREPEGTVDGSPQATEMPSARDCRLLPCAARPADEAH
jgi:uncharacterized protein (DUF433 family)